MKRFLKRYLRLDTLAKRLFVLIWGSLIVAQLLAVSVVQLVSIGDERGMFGGRGIPGPMATLPVLPPTPGVPGHGGRMPRGPAPPDANEGEWGHPPDDRPRDMPGRRHEMGLRLLLIDYGVRFLVIGIAAWYGSRWVSQPMRKLVGASQALGDSLAQGGAAPRELDETTGTMEVRETAKVFNTMSRQLREQFRARGLMMAAISHDLRTPLTRMRMRLEMMESPEPELQQKNIADLREMNALIDNALEVFRGADGNPEPMMKIDVAALLQSMTDDLAEQGQPVAYSGEQEMVTLAQPAALRRVFGNLVDNALRYGGRADVNVQRVGSELHITIDDAGPGIPQALMDNVFQPFFRVDASRSKHTGGTGLGLYIARDLAQRQGGTLTLANRHEGREIGGLRATLVLPLR
ncbi:ATP-binding protein [Paucibacter sp. R3-3]|uniref:histidine kinase n=1 Tax=Roseateles agri TaxID=3098619 RepID=A0ABU5DB51_9BURK|nr:ATP-binding protein [Paucibacter sp. R3-3]MDY0743498.1 ATP-binding protein [Paucibacter sp. R3-3]